MTNNIIQLDDAHNGGSEPTLTFFEFAERVYGIGEIFERQVDFGLFREQLSFFSDHVVVGRVIGPVFDVGRHSSSVCVWIMIIILLFRCTDQVRLWA